MNVGILTFHDAHNYGAVLQAYALQEYIKSHGHKVCFLDYRLPYVNKYYKWFVWEKILRKNVFAGVNELIRLPLKKKRYDAFKLFISKNFSQLRFDSANINETLDLLIVGSDQLWNYVLTGGFDNLYWGNIPGFNKQKITYAISMEVEPNNKIINNIKENLKNFDEISVRETKLKEKLQPFVSKEIKLCLDPTMLVPVEVWDKVIGDPIVKEPYVFLYQVRPSKKAEAIASRIADIRKCKVIKLYASVDNNSSPLCFGAGPSEFLNLIKYAKHVVSVSFHGTILPIAFHVPFSSVLLGDGKDDRVLSILKMLELENLTVTDPNSVTLPFIDWDSIDVKIKKIRKESEDYLEKYV